MLSLISDELLCKSNQLSKAESRGEIIVNEYLQQNRFGEKTRKHDFPFAFDKIQD